jgi:hypothetical protein
MLHAGQSGLIESDKHLAEIEGFSLASFHWAVTAFFVFFNMAANDAQQKLTLDQAVQRVEAWRN